MSQRGKEVPLEDFTVRLLFNLQRTRGDGSIVHTSAPKTSLLKSLLQDKSVLKKNPKLWSVSNIAIYIIYTVKTFVSNFGFIK